jgi:hypothetical protein
MAPPDLSITQSPSTRPVRPSPVLYIRSPTPATILIAARHAAHQETSKCDSPNETKKKVKQLNRPRFEFKPHQVNDSSQSNHGTDHLVSQIHLVKEFVKILQKKCTILSLKIYNSKSSILLGLVANFQAAKGGFLSFKSEPPP